MQKIDLHNDLLNYLATDACRSAYDDGLECSISEMVAGSIRIQVLAAFSLSPHRSSDLTSQFGHFLQLRSISECRQDKIQFLWAIEDAQQLASDSAKPEKMQKKFDRFRVHGALPVYVSLTWKNENSFGGGDSTDVGLKPLGADLLDLLYAAGIAVDLSHASDKLADEIVNYRERRGMKGKILISHTSFRGINHAKRNVTDDVARYILEQRGLIGLSFSRNQLGVRNSLSVIDNLSEHYEYALSIDARFRKVLCLGGDLYHQADVPSCYRREPSNFYPELSRSGQYSILDNLDKGFLYGNARTYFEANGILSASKH